MSPHCLLQPISGGIDEASRVSAAIRSTISSRRMFSDRADMETALDYWAERIARRVAKT